MRSLFFIVGEGGGLLCGLAGCVGGDPVVVQVVGGRRSIGYLQVGTYETDAARVARFPCKNISKCMPPSTMRMAER